MEKAVWKNQLKADSTNWLLDSNPCTKYKTLTDLSECSATEAEVIKAKNDLAEHQDIKQLISEAAEWFPESITAHNKPNLSYYKLRMLSDFLNSRFSTYSALQAKSLHPHLQTVNSGVDFQLAS